MMEQLEKAITSDMIAQLENKIGENERSVKDLIIETEALQNKIDEVGKRVERNGKRIEKLDRKTQQLDQRIEKLDRKTQQLDQRIEY